MNPIISQFESKLIVSCQALEHEPLHGSQFMKQMAIAVIEGGASAIRANSPSDIRAIRSITQLPIIGLFKKDYEGCEVYITPTIKEVDEIVEAGSDIIAFDATNRLRPNAQSVADFVAEVKAKYPDLLLMADISTYEEGVHAQQIGVDIVSTTMAGYTAYTSHIKSYSFELLDQLVRDLSIPVISEGKVNTPEEARQCFEHGAFSVVVGTAITRPQEITKTFLREVYKA